MIKNNERLIVYLNSTVNSVFKVLPLYEEQNVGVHKHIDSLLFELYGLEKSVLINHSYEYISILSTLESIKKEVILNDDNKAVVKREIFRCINIIKNMISKLEEGE